MYQKAELILVLCGRKPATNIGLYKNNDDPEIVREALLRAGFAIAEKEIPSASDAKQVADIMVALDQKTADTLAQLNPKEDHDAFGRLMGFPDTARKAFGHEDEALTLEEYPDMTGIPFRFKLSRDHWQDEMATLQDWSKTIKQHAPELYTELCGGPDQTGRHERNSGQK